MVCKCYTYPMYPAISLIVSLLLAYGAGFVGSFFTGSAIDTWYATLDKPFLNPPNWVFAPMWTFLYTLMAFAAWRIFQKRAHPQAKGALALYGVHLILNAFWSVAFFGWHNPTLAFAVIVALWACIFALTVLFRRIDRTAGLLFIPYLAWVSFALYLNLMFVI